jgi:CheY-like chemotaxis protein
MRTDMRWLVADDSELDRAVACRAILQDDPGASILEVANGRDAIRAIDAEHFDAVLTDVIMPGGLTGHDVVNVAQARGVPTILVMTGVAGLAPSDVPVIVKGGKFHVEKYVVPTPALSA